MSPELSDIGITVKGTAHHTYVFANRSPANTILSYQGSTRDFAKARLAMERIADTTALALLGEHGKDTITRYALNPNAANALNSSSLLVINDKSGAIKGIYHVSGDQFDSNLQYKPVNLLQANQLLEEAVQSARYRDQLNASVPEYATQELKYLDLKNTFIKATAGYDDSSVTSTSTQELQANQKTIRPVWLQNIDRMQTKSPSTDAFMIAYNGFWNKVINNTGNFIDGSSGLLHEQPIMLNAAKGTKNWQQYLLLIEQNGAPKLFLAIADREKQVTFEEIDAFRALELATAGYDGDAGIKAAQKFTDILKRYEYPPPESLMATDTSGTNKAKSTSPDGKQRGYAYAAPDWLTEHLPDKENVSFKNILGKLEGTLANSPDAIKTAGYLMLAPAIYEIAEKTQEIYESSGTQAAVNTASQKISQLYAGIEAGVSVSPYTLPLLATPNGDIAYLASTLVAGMGGSQAMEAIENGTMYLWQKLAVEPLQAQAKEREQLKQQDQSALKQHLDIVNSIPDEPPLKRSPAETLAHHIQLNAAQNEWSLEKTCEALKPLFTHLLTLPQHTHRSHLRPINLPVRI